MEDALIGIAGFTDDRDIPVALQGKTLHIPRQLVFVAERLIGVSIQNQATADNDVNALVSKGMITWWIPYQSQIYWQQTLVHQN